MKMKRRFGYVNPTALEVEAKVEEFFKTAAGGLLKLSDIIAQLGLPVNKSNEVMVGKALRRNGFIKIRTYPEKQYFWTKDTGEELLDAAREKLRQGEASCQPTI